MGRRNEASAPASTLDHSTIIWLFIYFSVMAPMLSNKLHSFVGKQSSPPVPSSVMNALKVQVFPTALAFSLQLGGPLTAFASETLKEHSSISTAACTNNTRCAHTRNDRGKQEGTYMLCFASVFAITHATACASQLCVNSLIYETLPVFSPLDIFPNAVITVTTVGTVP